MFSWKRPANLGARNGRLAPCKRTPNCVSSQADPSDRRHYVAPIAFEGSMQALPFLTFFIPLIIASGGNSGSQASTLVIRAMAMDEVRLRDWWRVARREIATGLLLGAVLGTIGFLRVVLFPGAVADLGGNAVMLMALTMTLSLLGVVLFGTLVGSMLPFLLRRAGLDPASASAPLVATLVDVTGLLIYYWAASSLLL